MSSSFAGLTRSRCAMSCAAQSRCARCSRSTKDVRTGLRVGEDPSYSLDCFSLAGIRANDPEQSFAPQTFFAATLRLQPLNF